MKMIATFSNQAENWFDQAAGLANQTTVARTSNRQSSGGI